MRKRPRHVKTLQILQAVGNARRQTNKQKQKKKNPKKPKNITTGTFRKCKWQGKKQAQMQEQMLTRTHNWRRDPNAMQEVWYKEIPFNGNVFLFLHFTCVFMKESMCNLKLLPPFFLYNWMHVTHIIHNTCTSLVFFRAQRPVSKLSTTTSGICSFSRNKQ